VALPEEPRQSSEPARAIEAILMVAQEPVEPHLLAQLLEIAPARVEELCDALEAEYQEQDRGFTLVKVAGGYRFQSHGDLAAYVERFALEGQSARLSSAALETLAIVAYKQPLSRAQIAAIRGSTSTALSGTSTESLERMGLDRIEDLPAIADLFPSAEVMEALEQTLRASAPDDDGPATLPLDQEEPAAPEVPADEPPAEGTGAEEPPVVQPTTVDPALLAMSDDDFPEPEVPSWAVDPRPAAPAEEAGGPDIDGDGQADLPVEP